MSNTLLFSLLSQNLPIGRPRFECVLLITQIKNYRPKWLKVLLKNLYAIFFLKRKHKNKLLHFLVSLLPPQSLFWLFPAWLFPATGRDQDFPPPFQSPLFSASKAINIPSQEESGGAITSPLIMCTECPFPSGGPSTPFFHTHHSKPPNFLWRKAIRNLRPPLPPFPLVLLRGLFHSAISTFYFVQATLVLFLFAVLKGVMGQAPFFLREAFFSHSHYPFYHPNLQPTPHFFVSSDYPLKSLTSLLGVKIFRSVQVFEFPALRISSAPFSSSHYFNIPLSLVFSFLQSLSPLLLCPEDSSLLLGSTLPSGAKIHHANFPFILSPPYPASNPPLMIPRVVGCVTYFFSFSLLFF